MTIATETSSRSRARGRAEPGKSAVIDRARLDADIAELVRKHDGDKQALRKAAMERFREALERGRETARDMSVTSGLKVAISSSVTIGSRIRNIGKA